MSPDLPNSPRRDPVARIFLALAILGLALLTFGILIERRFWVLWLTGVRTTAAVITVDDDSVFDLDDRPNHSGASHVVYLFESPAGMTRGTAEVRHVPAEWKTRPLLDIVYSRSNPSRSMPASWAFLIANDPVWLLALLADLLGLALATAFMLGWLGASRSGRIDRTTKV